jgi:uncharacterized protein YndB with AHSA1/START domain
VSYPEGEKVERELSIAARPETVFSFFTDPLKLAKWMGQAEVMPEPGGKLYIDLNGRYQGVGEFLEIVPNQKIVFTLGWVGTGSQLPPNTTIVEVLLVPEGEGTRLYFRHFGIPKGQAEGQAYGWDYYLARLAIAATGGDPGADDNWDISQ